MATIAERIKSRREALGMSQMDLASQIKLSREAVSQWENGSTEPSPKRVRAISDALRCRYVWLQTGEGDWPNSVPEATEVEDIWNFLTHRSSHELDVMARDLGRHEGYFLQFALRSQISDLPEDVRSYIKRKVTNISKSLTSDTYPSESQVIQKKVATRDSMVIIIERDGRTAMGSSTTGDYARNQDIVAEWELPASAVNSATRARPEDMRIVRVRGDVNRPLLNPGDPVMIDTTDRIPSPGGFFAYAGPDGSEAIRRLEMVPFSDPPEFVMVSASKEYPDYKFSFLEHRDKILGRVVRGWFPL